LKKLGIRDASITRSALKVRWNDMIEITNVIEINDNSNSNLNSSNMDSSSDAYGEYNYNNNNDDSDSDDDDFDEDLNGDLYDEDDDNDEDENPFDEQVNDENEVSDGEVNPIKVVVENKNSVFSGKAGTSSDSTSDSSSVNLISEVNQILNENKRNSVSSIISKVEHFNLKPLHSIGREFEKEMNGRIERLNVIKVKQIVDSDNEKFFDDIHADLDTVLYELHSTIEHVRLSSMMISNMKRSEHDEDRLTELNSILLSQGLNGEKNKIGEIVANCREFVNNSKTMISAALINETEVKVNVRNAMNSVCSLVVHCFENSFLYLYKNEKLDEIRQLLIQLLNLLNTFRVTLNITYLASAKQLTEANVGMLMKQATSLANEIGVLIKHFKLLI
jgi:hypothetical protein